MKNVRLNIDGKTYLIPEFLHFENEIGYYAWEFDRWGTPKKNDYFLSGAIIIAYKAPNDLTSNYIIIKRLHKVKPQTKIIYVPA